MFWWGSMAIFWWGLLTGSVATAVGILIIFTAYFLVRGINHAI